MILLLVCRGQINQIEVNPFLYRKQTIDFFQAQGVTIQAYRSLFAGQGKKALDHPLVTSIAEAHGTTHHHGHTPTKTTQAVAPSRYRRIKPAITRAPPTAGKSAAQVLGRWAVQHGLIYIPKSEKTERMLENAAVFDFELTAVRALPTPSPAGLFRTQHSPTRLCCTLNADLPTTAWQPLPDREHEHLHSTLCGFGLGQGELASLDGLTEPASIEAFEALYRKCVVRDTPLEGTMEGVKAEITSG